MPSLKQNNNHFKYLKQLCATTQWIAFNNGQCHPISIHTHTHIYTQRLNMDIFKKIHTQKKEQKHCNKIIHNKLIIISLFFYHHHHHRSLLNVYVYRCHHNCQFLCCCSNRKFHGLYGTKLIVKQNFVKGLYENGSIKTISYVYTSGSW